MKFAFICATPFQLLNIVNFVYHDVEKSKGNSDIYLALTSGSAEEIKGNLIKLGIFRKIFIVKPQKQFTNKVKNKAHSLYIFSKETTYFRTQIYSDQVPQKGEYNIIVVPCATLLFEAFVSYFKPQRVYFIDDGLGSYFGNIQLSTLKKERLYMAKIFGRFFDVNKLYVNNVDFCYSEVTDIILSLPHDESADYNNALLNLFNYNINDIYSRYRVVYLHQPLNELGKGISRKEQEIFHELKDYIGDNLIIRPHPRIFQEEMYKGTTIDNINNMWELVCLKEITDNHILVGVSSTAQVSPKLLLNKEPYVIFTFYLYPEDEAVLKGKEIIFKNLRNNYSRPEKVQAPKNLNELRDFLKEFQGII